MELQEVLENRYSCRRFAAEQPNREQIEAVLAAGRLAPTACNNQPQRLYVITDQRAVEKMDEVTRCRYGAPCMIVVGYDVDEAASHAKTDPAEPWGFGELDIASVITHMILKAQDLGMATCWLGAFGEEHCRQVLGIPGNVAIRAIIDLGFPSEKAKPSPMHDKRKVLEETVFWL